MDLGSLAAAACVLLAYALVSGRLEGTVLTPPLVLVLAGLALGAGGLGVATLDPGHGAIHVVAEATLVLVLFADAARIDLRRLGRDHDLPVRMLLVALPGTIALGTLAALVLFPDFSPWEAALLAALLAPTDAALGQSVVSAPAVPARIRQAINVESGLNDGIALPAVLLFAALASAEHAVPDAAAWITFGALQVILGPLVGLGAGLLGGRALDAAAARGWASASFQGIGILALALLAYVGAELIGGNGFIAAFVGGATFGATLRHPCTFLFEFMETEGQLLMLVTFLLFGAALLPEALEHATPQMFLYAAASLTVVRMAPVALSLLGTGVRVPTHLFLGWFGPRGLASILFALLILDETDIAHGEELLSITVLTVALSVLAHGVSAAPLARVYAARVVRMGRCEERARVSPFPLREGPGKTFTEEDASA